MQGDAEAWDGGVLRSKETGTPGQEYRGVARSLVGPGRWAAKMAQKRKKKGDDGRRVCSAAARKNGVDCIPVAPSEARPRDLDALQVDNPNPPPERASGELRRE